MILQIQGDINPYYVQTLCMIFFPGAKFSRESNAEDAPQLRLRLSDCADGSIEAEAVFLAYGKESRGTDVVPFQSGRTLEKQKKIAAGKAIFNAGKAMFRYAPPWGILTGVRPSKVATDLLQKGNTPTRAKRVLRDEYFLNPQKAALAVSVAQTEMSLTAPAQDDRCSVYVSIPFCPTRCAYCSFVSYTTPRLLSLIDDYLRRLMQDLCDIFTLIKELSLTVATVYVGGGTPTILSVSQLETLLSHISSLVDVDSLEEFTVEGGRPDTLTAEKMAVCRRFGVTRVSVNPQTLSDEMLQKIGRRHTVREFFDAYETVRASGIPHVNVDLIAGLPGDTFLNFASGFDRILELSPDNLTVHTFCVKKASGFLRSGSGVYSRSDSEAAKSVAYSQIQAKLAGYHPYYLYRQKNTVGNLENVGYAKEGVDGMYNIYMMEELHTVFAAGAGSVSKLLRRQKDGGARIERIFAPKYPYEYLEQPDGDGVVRQLADRARLFYVRDDLT